MAKKWQMAGYLLKKVKMIQLIVFTISSIFLRSSAVLAGGGLLLVYTRKQFGLLWRTTERAIETRKRSLSLSRLMPNCRATFQGVYDVVVAVHNEDDQHKICAKYFSCKKGFEFNFWSTYAKKRSFLPPPGRREVKGLSELLFLLLRNFSDILIFWEHGSRLT